MQVESGRPIWLHGEPALSAVADDFSQECVDTVTRRVSESSASWMLAVLV
jgi:hypothetical protein